MPRRALLATLKGDESCAEALALFVQSANAQMVANRTVVLETDDPEGAHQLRIAAAFAQRLAGVSAAR